MGLRAGRSWGRAWALRGQGPPIPTCVSCPEGQGLPLQKGLRQRLRSRVPGETRLVGPLPEPASEEPTHVREVTRSLRPGYIHGHWAGAWEVPAGTRQGQHAVSMLTGARAGQAPDAVTRRGQHWAETGNAQDPHGATHSQTPLAVYVTTRVPHGEGLGRCAPRSNRGREARAR